MGKMFNFGLSRKTETTSRVTWESRYDGVFSVAFINQMAVAGISGPWPDGSYALTWWSKGDQQTAPSLEFHTSLTLARLRVEEVANCPTKSICVA